MSQDHLTEDAIKEAYNKFQQQDVNRGTGFFRVHALANKLWYTNDKYSKKLVKSTLGELGFNILHAIKNAPKPEDESCDSVADKSRSSL